MRNKNLGLAMRLSLVLIVALGIFIYNMADLHETEKRKQEAQEQKEMLDAQIERMEYYLDGSIDYEEIVRIARERYHLTFPDETVIYSGQGIGP
jgi:hypothetical protein